LLADFIKTPWPSRLLASKNKAAVVPRCSSNEATTFCDAPQLRYDVRRIVHCLKHRVAKNYIELPVVKGHPATIGRYPGQVISPEHRSRAAGCEKVALLEIYADDSTP
jgi:hypothetical protein